MEPINVPKETITPERRIEVATENAFSTLIKVALQMGIPLKPFKNLPLDFVSPAMAQQIINDEFKLACKNTLQNLVEQKPVRIEVERANEDSRIIIDLEEAKKEFDLDDADVNYIICGGVVWRGETAISLPEEDCIDV